MGELRRLLSNYPDLPLYFAIDPDCYEYKDKTSYVGGYNAHKRHIYIYKDDVYYYDEIFKILYEEHASDFQIPDEKYDDYVRNIIKKLDNFECIVIEVYP